MSLVSGSAPYIATDQMLIDQIVYELKSQGIFDSFRKECIADVDTKPAYQNLRQRVEGSVSSFLKEQKWNPESNKNQLREMLRKNIYESGFLETGVERIVNQVVNPKINTVFMPKVKEVFYKYIGLQTPVVPPAEVLTPEVVEIPKAETKEPETLLPTDLEAISPDNDATQDSGAMDDYESPPFEPIDEDLTFKILPEENSVDSQVSGISGLISHDSQNSKDAIVIMTVETDSQLSKNSSGDDRLSIVTDKSDIVTTEVLNKTTSDEESKETITMDVDAITCVKDDKIAGEIKIKEEENEIITDEGGNIKEETPTMKEGSHKIKEENPKIKEENLKIKEENPAIIEEKIKEETPNIKEENHKIVPQVDKIEAIVPESKKVISENETTKHSSSHKSDRDKDKTRSDRKDRDRHSSSSRSSKDKSRDSRDNKDKARSDSSKSKSSSSRDKDGNSKSSRHSSDSKERSSTSSSTKKSSSSSSINRDKDKTSSSSSKDKRTSKDHSSLKSSSHSKSKSSTSSKSDKSRSDNRKYSSSSSRDDSVNKHSTSKDKRDKKDTKDDHFSSKHHKSERRSTDRDSNDGQTKSTSNSTTNLVANVQCEYQRSNNNTTEDSCSKDGSNSDTCQVSDVTALTHSLEDSKLTLADSKLDLTLEESKLDLDKVVSEPNPTQIPDFVETLDAIKSHLAEYKTTESTDSSSNSSTDVMATIKLPKFASNIKEARKIMKLRKQLKQQNKLNKMLQQAKQDSKMEVVDDSAVKVAVDTEIAVKVTADSIDSKAVSTAVMVTSDSDTVKETVEVVPIEVTKLADNEGDCLYLDKVSERTTRYLSYTSNVIEKLSKEIDGMDPQKCIPKRKALKRKISTISSDSSSINNDSNTDEGKFALPLSPAESDMSLESRKSTSTSTSTTATATVRVVKQRRIYNSKATQRYTSDDLYKPRPFLKGTTKRTSGRVAN